MRRVVSRSAVKGVFPLLGLPIVAFWNAVLAKGVMSSVRTVGLGRMFIVGVTDAILGVHQELTRQVAAGVDLQMAVELSRTKSFAMSNPEASFDPQIMPEALKYIIFRSVATAVISTRAFHPNLELMLKHIIYRLRIDPLKIPDVDNMKLFTDKLLPSLSRLDSYTVLTIMSFALVLDGSMAVTEKLLMKRAQAACGLQPHLAGLMNMSRKFVSLVLEPQDVVFCYYDMREREGGLEDITLMEQIEDASSQVLRILSF